MRYLGTHWEWIEEWSQFFQSCNWYTFHPFMCEFEDDRIMGGVEFSLMIMGIGFRVRWNYAETEQYKRIKGQVADIERREYETD